MNENKSETIDFALSFDVTRIFHIDIQFVAKAYMNVLHRSNVNGISCYKTKHHIKLYRLVLICG